MNVVRKFGYVPLLIAATSAFSQSLVLPPDMMNPDVTATKAEYVACRNAAMRSCFAPIKCDESYKTAPCVKVVCPPVPVGKDKDGEAMSAMIGGYDGGGPASWAVGTILSADDFSGFRSETWEGAKSNPNRVNFCSSRFEALGFIWQYGTAADKALLKNVRTTAAPPAGASRIAATSPGSASAPSQSSVASCTDEIRRVQLESQSWTGNADDVAARLGRFQKDLFEGRCWGHPEAQAYINGANKMLAYGGNPSGSSGGTTAMAAAPLAPIRRDTQSKEHNPAHNASTCIKVYGPIDMKARGLKSIMNSMLVNTCPYNVSVMWCIEPGNGHAGDCGRGYSNTWDLTAAGKQGSTWGIPADGQMVQYAACRHGPNMGFQPVEKDPRNPYRFSCS